MHVISVVEKSPQPSAEVWLRQILSVIYLDLQYIF